MVLKVVAFIPIYLHLSLCVNTPTVTQTFSVWQAFLLTITGMEDDLEYPQDRPQEYRLHSYHPRQIIIKNQLSTSLKWEIELGKV